MNKKWLVARAKEPSTWAGIFAFLTAVGITVRPELKDALITLGIALAGVIGVATIDRKDEN